MKRLPIFCFALLLGATSLARAEAQAQRAGGGATAIRTATISENGRRTALVIGNGAYKVAPLVNPVADARMVAEALLAARFRVIRLENASRETMLKAITEFGNEIDLGGVGVFYYAGHGVQVRGENYLVPVDAKIDREEEIRTRSVNAQEILDRMASARNGLNLVFLDACRNDPFPRASRSVASGLAKMDAAWGTLISFATSPGSVAEDGERANSPYSRHLAATMREPGLRIEDVLKRVRAQVREETRGRQITWDNSSIEGDFYFHPGEARAAAAASAVDSGPQAETVFWNSIKDSQNPREFEIYLKRYPDGAFAELAQERIAALQAEDAPAEPPPVARTTRPTAKAAASAQTKTVARTAPADATPPAPAANAAPAPALPPQMVRPGGNAADQLNAMGIAVAPNAAVYAAMQRNAARAAGEQGDGDMRALALQAFPRIDPDRVSDADVRRAQQLQARLADVRNANERRGAARGSGGAGGDWLQQVQAQIEGMRFDQAESTIRARERALGLAGGR
jgi:uncharacterized caspase-like protein